MLTITVDTLVDEADGSIGDGDISLRDAINWAPVGETIDFSVTGTIDLTLGELLIGKSLTISGPGAGLLTIDASGSDAEPGIDQGDGARVFRIDDGDSGTNANVTIEGLTLTGGDVTGSGGAILSLENLTLTESSITGNTASSRGGGVYSYGANGATTSVSYNNISDNVADHGGGIFAFSNTGATTSIHDNTVSYNIAHISGGNIRTNTTDASGVTITDNLIDHGTASSGGGIFAFTSVNSNTDITGNAIADNFADTNAGGAFIHTVTGGGTTVAGNQITDNASDIDGGGLYVISSGSGSSTTITLSTISGNTATRDGGGVYLYTYSDATTSLVDSTVSGNMAYDDAGGIRGFSADGGQLRIDNSTISGNIAADRGGGLRTFTYSGALTTITSSTIVGNGTHGVLFGGFRGSGLSTSGSVEIVLSNTIVAQNLQLSGRPDDIGGTLAAASQYNFIGVDVGLFGITDGAGGNQIGTFDIPIDPMVGPLQDNGGPTLTHALLSGSPAIDAGDPAFIGLPDFDQRGAPFGRVHNVVVDIGAVEAQSLSLVVDTTTDENDGDYSLGDLSLREAIELSNANPLPDTISFDASLDAATILLTLGELAITDSVTIDASGLAGGLTVDASGNDPTPGEANGDGSRIFNINDDVDGNKIDVEIVSLTLTGGDVTGDGGAIFSVENLAVTNSTITGNSAHDGGGIWVFTYDSLTAITGSTISGNAARSNGGGLWAITFTGSTTISGSTLASNTAADTGGGVYARTYAGGDTTITSSTISGNSAGTESAYGYGGGIALLSFSATSTVASSTISGNTAYQSGGGLHTRAFDGTVEITNSTISGNSAARDGGGVYGYTYSGGTTSISHSTVTNNTADADNIDGGDGGGLSLAGAANASLDHTIVAGNALGDSSDNDVAATVDAASAFNLVGVDAGMTGISHGAGGNQIGTIATPIDALLAPLANRGGPTFTHDLLAGSPAIDAGDPMATSGVGDTPTNDQRSGLFVRVSGAAIDIGAFEQQPLVIRLGDGNLDGFVDYDDFDILVMYWGDNPAADPPGSPGNGDFNNDGKVGDLDYLVWAANFGAVPTPAGEPVVVSDAEEGISVAAVASEQLAPLAAQSVIAQRDSAAYNWMLRRAFDSVLEKLDEEQFEV